MKKKKTMASAAASAAAAASASATAVSTPPEPDLKTLIGEHSVFFDRLVDLIPARFYLPLDDEDRPWYQGLSKAAKASVKIQSRENLKKARRARLDPAAPPSSTLDLLSKSLAAAAAASSDSDPNPNPSSDEGDDKDDDDDEEEEEEEEENEAEVEAHRPAETMDDRSATDVGLRQRLQARIAELRSTRNTRPETINKPKKEKKKENKSKKKKKINKEEEGGAPSSPLGKRKRDEEESNAAPTDISFGKVRSGGEGDQNKGKKKKKLSKQQELERARQLEEAKKDPEKGDKYARKHSWKAAASRAAGEKVHDDPKLLKESIKREERSRKKHAEKWKERMDTVEKARAEKQKTRADNIRGRAEQKRMRRIEKREKKLLRPGFEGRKEGYING